MDTTGRNIIISNLPALDTFDQSRLDTTINQFYDKMARISPEGAELKIHFKDYQKEGKRQKHVIHASFHYPGHSIREEEWDWDLIVATHNAMKKLLHNLQRSLGKD